MTDSEASPTVATLLDIHAKQQPARLALSCQGRTTDYAALRTFARAVAQGLFGRGMESGDRIAYIGQNSDDYFILLYGAATAGIVMVPISWRLTVPEVRDIIQDSGAKWIFADPNRYALALEACQHPTEPSQYLAEVLPSDAFRAWPTAPEPAARWGGDQPCAPMLQLYTSGTTGKPKGVVLTQANVFRPRPPCASGEVPWDRWRPNDVGLVTMPIAHIAGTSWGTLALNAGATSLIAPQFIPRDMLRQLRDEGATKLFLVPAALQQLLDEPDLAADDFRNVGTIYYGASPIALPLLQALMNRLRVNFCQLYGLTETSGAIVGLHPCDHDPDQPELLLAAGRALPGVELKILSADGSLCAPGETGEIVTRSNGTMAGYWQLPKATAETVDSQGWLKTGDAGYLDAAGYLFLRDRIKDMIVTGAENVYPAEIESVLKAHPDIVDVAVIGIPDARWGEAVKAIVVPRHDSSVTEADILRFSRRFLAGFKVPKSVDFIDALPRTASGKILKRELRQPYWRGSERGVN